MSVLEIGIGPGGIINLLINKIKEYYGVDISWDNINILTEKYSFIDSVKLSCLDVCDPSSSLNKFFDVIISADTLEHVEYPQGYFNFIQKHLKNNGIAIVIFPNESKERHHGITWFSSKNDLVKVIKNSQLRIINIYEVNKTIMHKFIGYYFWRLPKYIIKHLFMKQLDLVPQSFDQTDSYKIIRDGGIKANIFELYAKTITRLARVFPLYEVTSLYNNDIRNKHLLIKIMKFIKK